MNTRVLVADDHPVVRQGLKSLLTREGFSVVGEAADGREALRQVEALRPEVALLDLGMPGLNGLDAAREIMQSSAGTKVVILTQHAEEPYILEALRAGVHGYVLKSQSVSDGRVGRLERAPASTPARQQEARSLGLPCFVTLPWTRLAPLLCSPGHKPV